jgi:predicted ATPase
LDNTFKLNVNSKPFAIREMHLPESIATEYSTDLSSPVLHQLSRLNVFIGANNTGKSRLLRSLFSSQSTPLGLRDSQSEEIRESVKTWLKIAPPEEESLRRELANKIPLLYQRGYTIFGSGPPSHELSISSQVGDPDTILTLGRMLTRMREYFHIQNWKRRVPDLQDFFRVYIPTLRGLRRPIQDTHFYSVRTKKDYFHNLSHVNTWSELSVQHPNSPEAITKVNVHTGLEMYDIVRSHLLGPREARQMIADFQKEIGRTFYGGREFTLIPREGDDVLHAKIGNEAERPVYELGDGIQHMLIMMLPLFIHRDKNLLLFVEEPELYLHPGFQRILIDKFLDDDYVSRQVFVTTHSHQFLDITIDRERCSVYRVSKNLEDGETEAKAMFKVQLASSDDFSILAELGVRNSSVMLSNCTIWVEGITDRLYLRRFLDIYQKSKELHAYMEDLHYSFVEYGGGCIEHWSFLDRDDKEPGIEVKRLCGNLFLIADQDTGKEERHDLLKKVLGDRFCLLDCLEVENLLIPSTITSIVEQYEGTITLQEFEQDDYKSESLGTFIDAKVLPVGYNSKRIRKEGSKGYADASGTVKNKTDFCHKALEHIKTIDDLSPEARNLCERIYMFIAAHNQ